MLDLMIHQPRQRGALPTVPLLALLAGQRPESGEVLVAGAHLEKLKSKSLMFDAASDSRTKIVPGHLLKTCRRERTPKAKEKQILFSP
jgi:hypothetical protein